MSEPTRVLLTGIVATVREPLIVLDDQLRIVTASHSFYNTFQVSPVETEGAHIYDLGDGQWDIPALRHLLETIVPQNTTMETYEVEHDFPGIGSRCMLLNARRIQSAEGHATTLLLAMQDVTDLKAAEREKDELLRQKDLLLQEMRHRVNNSLQIIASILLLKAHSVRSKETRRHLQDAHSRVMAVATVQEQLRPATYARINRDRPLSSGPLQQHRRLDGRRQRPDLDRGCGRQRLDDLDRRGQPWPDGDGAAHQCAKARLSWRYNRANQCRIPDHANRLVSFCLR